MKPVLLRRTYESGHITKIAVTPIYEPPLGKTNNVVSEQVRHKPACTATEAG